MATKEYNLSINEENKVINLTGISESAISIDYSGDVDFTRLVSGLASFMDNKLLLSPSSNNGNSDESSIMLILDTIKKIIDEYNLEVEEFINEELVANSEEEADN